MFLLLFGLAILLPSPGFSKPAAGNAAAWSKTIDEGETQYLLKVDPGQRRIEVLEEGPTRNVPRHLRVLIHRKNDRPFELGLVPMMPDPARQADSLRYSGRVDRWNQSYIGFELQVSFDKKTWKRVGHLIQKVLP